MNQSVHPSQINSASLVRVFCAVELPSAIREQAAHHIARLRSVVPGVRASWDRAEKLHVTLKFLGQIEQNRIEDLSGAIQRAAASVPPFEAAIEGAGSFPLRGLPRVLWLGVNDPSGGFALLWNRLEDECAAENFEREKRPFHPHLTIARLHSPDGARKLANVHQEIGFELMSFSIQEILLIQSVLDPAGSRYTVLARQRLSADKKFGE